MFSLTLKKTVLPKRVSCTVFQKLKHPLKFTFYAWKVFFLYSIYNKCSQNCLSWPCGSSSIRTFLLDPTMWVFSFDTGYEMQSMFMKLSEYSSRSLRNTNTDLRIPSFTTSYGQRSFSYRGATVWNKLSTEIKNAPSLATFKHLLKQSLKNQRV